jgi:hypothetical protein
MGDSAGNGALGLARKRSHEEMAAASRRAGAKE